MNDFLLSYGFEEKKEEKEPQTTSPSVFSYIADSVLISKSCIMRTFVQLQRLATLISFTGVVAVTGARTAPPNVREDRHTFFASINCFLVFLLHFILALLTLKNNTRDMCVCVCVQAGQC